ncbi:nucleotidyltransferase family protein [Candidatus Uhrbacteria bacterium]|nr:nucleotidyltransferase family protein [Candidatus Uhrbacteria bacterium]
MTPILKARGIKRAGLFGSFASGSHRPDSDVDILVELKKEYSLIDVIGMKQELEQAVGRTVDVVEYRALKPRLRDRILKQQRAIL